MNKAFITVSSATEVKVIPTNDDWHPLSFNRVTIKDGKLNCTCAKFKSAFGEKVKSCEHTALLEVNEKEQFVWSSVMLAADSIKEIPQNVMEMNDVGIYNGGEVSIINPVRQSVDAFEIVQELRLHDQGSSKASVPFHQMGKSTGEDERGLNKVCTQIQKAVAISSALDAKGVTSENPTVTDRLIEGLDVVDEMGTSGNPWLDIPRPKDFFVTKENWIKILWSICRGKNTLLTGPTGCGKTELAQKAADALGYPFNAFNMGAMSEPRTGLIGATHLKEGETIFKEARFVQAIRADITTKFDDNTEEPQYGVVCMDEITRAVRGANNILLPVMDRQGVINLDEQLCDDAFKQVIRKSENVAFLATANIGVEYTGTDALDRALLDRFAVKIDIDYPPMKEEIKILKHRAPDCDPDFVKALCKVAQTQRKLYKDEEVMDAISTRMLIECAEMVEDQVPWEVALEATVLTCFNSEGDSDSDRAKVQQILQKNKLIN